VDSLPLLNHWADQQYSPLDHRQTSPKRPRGLPPLEGSTPQLRQREAPQNLIKNWQVSPELTQTLAKISTRMQNNYFHPTPTLPASYTTPNQDSHVTPSTQTDPSPSHDQANQATVCLPSIQEALDQVAQLPQSALMVPNQTSSQRLTTLTNLTYTLDPLLCLSIKIKAAHQDHRQHSAPASLDPRPFSPQPCPKQPPPRWQPLRLVPTATWRLRPPMRTWCKRLPQQPPLSRTSSFQTASQLHCPDCHPPPRYSSCCSPSRQSPASCWPPSLPT
jgi:hypothetical protein